MGSITVTDRVERVQHTCASATRDHGELTLALSDVARIESWAAARRAQLVAALAEQPDAFPEADIATTTGCTLGAATRETERATTLGRADAFADKLDNGDIRPGHVDALTNTTKHLDDEQTALLLDQQAELADIAATTTIRQFQDHLRRRADALRNERDREQRLERQRRSTRLRTWVDPSDGMWCLSGRFDPQTGDALHRALEATVTSLFNETIPDTAPDDSLERQHHLNALALAQLIRGEHTPTTRPGPPIVVVHTTTHPNTGTSSGHTGNAAATNDRTRGDTDAAHRSRTDHILDTDHGLRVEWGIPIELPLSVLRDLFDVTDPDIVVVADGIILHAPGNLNLGRSTRLANRAQRRALRALHPTCAVPGCAVHYDRCKLHHIIWWRNGGRTDLHNLVPLCQHHHTRIHEHGWNIHLDPQRHATVTLPNGRTLTDPPTKHRAA